MAQTFNKITDPTLKGTRGDSRDIVIITNSYHARGDVSDIANIYKFTSADLDADENIGVLLYGRTNSAGVFKSCKTVTNSLHNNYNRFAVDCFSIAKLIAYMHENNYANLGIAVEHYLCDFFGAKKCSEKQDKNRKQDLFWNGHFCQVKCSLATATTNGSYATTNDHI